MGTKPMNQEERKQARLLNLRRAQRCLATTRSGTLCQCPAIKGRRRCRLHGSARGAGGPRGRRNGQYKHGSCTRDAIRLRRDAAALLRALRRSQAEFTPRDGC